ncbi:MAG: APC family permease [Rhodospirillaceae bacterium]|nr:APC family permease [Rhodospirillaceae bacterium]
MQQHATRDGAGPSGNNLNTNALSVMDLLIAGMSYMAPGFSLFFTTAVIASFAGIHIPMMYLFAGLGVLCTGAALSEFSKLAPSAGSLQTFIARGFGHRASVAGGLVLLVGYLCLQAGVAVLFGGWTAELLQSWFGITVPWTMLTVIGVGICTLMMVRGLALSIKATWILFLIEFILVLLISLAVVLQGGAEGNTAVPFSLSSLGNVEMSAIAFGMVFATFSFVGFEGAISFAEETPEPKRALPVAVMGGIVAMVGLYILATYAAAVGFGAGRIGDLAQDPEPIASLAHRYASVLEPFLRFAVWTSIVANLMAAGNANARILFNLGREGALPSFIGKIHPRFQTPYLAVALFMALTLAPGLIAAPHWDYLAAFGNIAGFGAMLALLIYMTATAALPFYLRRHGIRLMERPFAHIVVPTLGTAIWLIPLWGTLQPGQPFPFNIYPLLAAALIVAAALYAMVSARKGRSEGLQPLTGSQPAD